MYGTRWKERQIDGAVDGLTNGLTDGLTDGSTDGSIDGDFCVPVVILLVKKDFENFRLRR